MYCLYAFSQGFVNKDGEVNQLFKSSLEYLSTKDGWFAPASEILDYILEQRTNSINYASKFNLLMLDMRWLLSRLKKKLLFKR